MRNSIPPMGMNNTGNLITAPLLNYTTVKVKKTLKADALTSQLNVIFTNVRETM